MLEKEANKKAPIYQPNNNYTDNLEKSVFMGEDDRKKFIVEIDELDGMIEGRFFNVISQRLNPGQFV